MFNNPAHYRFVRTFFVPQMVCGNLPNCHHRLSFEQLFSIIDNGTPGNRLGHKDSNGISPLFRDFVLL